MAVLLAVLLIVACGGGGNGAGTVPFGTGSGTSPLGTGAGTPGFGGGGGGAGQTGDGARPAADPTVVVSSAAIQGEVLNAGTGGALGGSTVSVGTSTLTVDTTGFYSLATYPATQRSVLQGSAGGFETLYLPATVVPGVPAVTVFKLTERGAAVSVTNATGGTVVGADNIANVSFAAGSLTSSPGLPVPSTVSVRLTTLAIAGDTFRISGDYQSNANEPLEAFGAVVLTNADGAQITAGMPARLRIPVSTRASIRPIGATFFYLDEATATWIAAGPAALDATASSYEGDATQFGHWMVGAAIAQSVPVSGCVVDDTGAPAANVRIAAEGISYSGVAYINTGVNGAYSLRVKPNSQVLLSGRRGAILTNAVSASSGSAGAVLSACLTLPNTNAATVRLTWGASPTDIDSHVHEPGGQHLFFSNLGSLTAEPFVRLDVDDTSGFGPEITTIRRPKAGIYRFYLHNYSRTFLPGMTQSPVSVELNYVGRTVVFSPPAGEGSSLYLHLFDLEVSSNCSMTLYRYNRWRADEPANPNGTTVAAQVCVPN